MQLVTQGTQSEIERMAAAQEVIEVRPEIELIDIEAHLIGIDQVVCTGNRVLIAVITRGNRAVQPVVVNMFPFKRNVAVTVTVRGVVVEIEMVFAKVACEIEAILFI